MVQFNLTPKNITKNMNKPIHYFAIGSENIDNSVITSFGDEWEKFYNFSNEEIEQIGHEYFGFLGEEIINKDVYALDIGCGTGRWTKYLSKRVQFIEAIDPSKAIIYADKLLKDVNNVRLSVASTDHIPFANESFDFVMSVGVLHHIPDTQKAMADCVKKVKIGGYFYVYLYYALDGKGAVFKFLFLLSDVIRRFTSSLPPAPKKWVCDFLAFTVYVPLVGLGKLIAAAGFKKFAAALPLSAYQDKSLFVIRNDALDRFGTKLEQRFTREQIREMMALAGLKNIIIPDGPVFWAAVGQKL